MRKHNFKTTSVILGSIGAIFIAISGLLALSQNVFIVTLFGVLGILCLVFSLYYYLRKPKKPETIGYIKVKGFKFLKK